MRSGDRIAPDAQAGQNHERWRYTQPQVLDEYHPNISNLLHGRISKVSIEKLLSYADRLRMRSSIEMRPPSNAGRGKPAKHGTAKDAVYA